MHDDNCDEEKPSPPQANARWGKIQLSTVQVILQRRLFEDTLQQTHKRETLQLPSVCDKSFTRKKIFEDPFPHPPGENAQVHIVRLFLQSSFST